MTTSSRIPYFDNAKGILILFVVWNHFIRHLSGPDLPLTDLNILFYALPMQAFTILAGYFYRPAMDSERMHRNFASLLVPYLILETLYSVGDHLIFGTAELVISPFRPYTALWFLLSLFVWRAALPYVLNFKFALPMTFAIGIGAGYVGQMNTFMTLQRIFAFFPFFLVGHLLEPRHFEYLKRWPVKVAAVGIILVAFWVAHQTPVQLCREFLLARKSYASFGWPEWYAGLGRLIMYASGFVLSAAFLALVPWRNTPFSAMGRRSMYPYLLHYWLVMLLRRLGLHETVLPTLHPVAASVIVLSMATIWAALLSTPPVRAVFKFIVEPSPKLSAKWFAVAMLIPLALIPVNSLNMPTGTFVDRSQISRVPGEPPKNTERGLDEIQIPFHGVVVNLKKKKKRNKKLVLYTTSEDLLVVSFYLKNKPHETKKKSKVIDHLQEGIFMHKVKVPKDVRELGYNQVSIRVKSGAKEVRLVAFD